jgi:hypothetical protein
MLTLRSAAQHAHRRCPLHQLMCGSPWPFLAGPRLHIYRDHAHGHTETADMYAEL